MSQIIDDLNKGGIEVEKYFFNKNDLFFDLKIPADRPDLKDYYYFSKEFFLNLGIRKSRKWVSLKKYYQILFKTTSNVKYKANIKHEIIAKKYKEENILLPTWIKKKTSKDLSYFYEYFESQCFFDNFNSKIKKDISKRFLYNYFQLYKQEIENPNFYYDYDYSVPALSKSISLRKQILITLIGQDNYDKRIIEKLGIKVIGETPEKFYFSIPYYRQDITREIDLIEEYCKALKYENFFINYPIIQSIFKNKERKIIELIKVFFLSHNYSEILTNSLISDKLKIKSYVKILNPLNKYFDTLIPSLRENHISFIQNLDKNEQKEIQVFEISRSFKKSTDKIEEIDCFQFTRVLKKDNTLKNWIKVKSHCDQFFDFMNFKEIQCINLNNKEITKSFSIFYKFDQKIIASLRLEKGKDKTDLFIFKLNLSTFLKELVKPKVKRIEEISKYPIIKKDLSFISNKNVNLYKLKDDVFKNFSFIKIVEYFDLYISEKGVKVGIRIKFQSFNQTLTNLEIDQEILSIIKYLSENYNLKLA